MPAATAERDAAGAPPFAYRRLREPAARRARAGRRRLGARARRRRALTVEPAGAARAAAAVLGARRRRRAFGAAARARAASAAIVLVLTVVVNVLVSREGLTVFARLGDWGPLGQVDLTVEAVVYGARDRRCAC